MQNKIYTINDPIHGLINLDDEDSFILPFVDHPHLQRLRYIKQMGLADMVFPAATHSRFSHSIGTASIARKIARNLGLTSKEIQLTTISALLHDIGHGPFSHAFENLFTEIGGIHHEEWTPLFLTEFQHKKFINDYNSKSFKLKIGEQDIRSIIECLSNKASNIYSDIVASQLDADRMDYLLRDSHFCGVKYGIYDINWIINNLTIATDPQQAIRLAVKEKGITSVEQFLFARYLMNKKIYYHTTIFALETYLIEFLRCILNIIKNHQFFPEEYTHTPLYKFLKLLAKCIKNKDKTSFMQSSFKLYNKLTDYDIYFYIREIHYNNIFDNNELAYLSRQLFNRIIPACLQIELNDYINIQEDIAEIIYNNKLYQWQITLIQNDNIFYHENNNIPIYIKDNQQLSPLSKYSDLSNKHSNLNSKHYYLVIDKAIINKPFVNKLLQKYRLTLD